MTKLTDYKLKWHNRNMAFIKCKECKKEDFSQKYYQTKNLLFLHIECFDKLQKEGENL